MSEKNFENMVGWVDISVGDLKRAVAFYGAMLDREIEIHAFDGYEFGVIDHGPGNGGCIVPDKDFKPQASGHLLYFDANGRMKAAIDAAVEKGGEVVQEPHSIGPHGWRALLLDSEGNRIALHSENND